jgi:two-component system NtrC family sensor kinase
MKVKSSPKNETVSGMEVSVRPNPVEIEEKARRALMARHRFSLKLQISLGFFLVFLLAVGIAAVMVHSMYQVEHKLEFLEIINDYVIEIQQARRFEKNYFLYGTNLDDALDNVYQARDIIERNPDELKQILGKDNHRMVVSNIADYQRLLEQLEDAERRQENILEHRRTREKIEKELREKGHQMVSLSQGLMNRLRVSVSETLLRSRMIHIYFLALLLIMVVFNAYILVSRILRSINRFTKYAQRIASGDFTPIMPRRRFRDEFTDLALAINKMIQELEQREEGLIQLHKVRAVGTLTAGIAHELNNPLNNIMLSAHMMLEDYNQMADDDKKDILNDIVSETNRSRNIISNLLDFARQSSSQVEPLNLASLIRDTIKLSANQIKLAGIRVEFQAADNLPQIHGDVQQLRQVFLNLIFNAIDASKKGDKIQVFVIPADEPDYVAVKVVDFGTGIPEHILNSIFDPFFTTKGKGKGTGLGLSVSQGIITKHGGRIKVSSRDGEGSTFTVTLPVTTIPADLKSM